MIECFFSCESYRIDVGPRTAKKVSEKFSREYTGLDTLIRTDGYYYRKDDTGLLHEPFIMSNDREFHILYVQYENHNRIQEKFGNNTPTARGKGSYTLSGDTIKARWAMPYQIGCYFIFSEEYSDKFLSDGIRYNIAQQAHYLHLKQLRDYSFGSV